jgi:recombinational DNA repair protein (RecF pathway)
LRAFELALLDLAGHRPAIDACAACGSAELAEGAVFDPGRGGAICRVCAAASRNLGVRPFDPSTRAYLRAIADQATPLAARELDHDPRFAPAARTAGRDAVVAMVSHLVARPLRSLEYLAKLGAASRRAKE